MSDEPTVCWVVDDDPDVATHLAMLLRRIGIEERIERFRDAAELRAALGRDVPAPALVLVDQVLPDDVGRNLLAEIRAAHPTAVVRLITAAPEEIDDVDRAIGVVSKPPSEDVVRALLDRALR